tara:strand:+ start:1444 stop:2175 length:732 start_codon:yes stop_codon:yes gene_type:complete
MLDKKAFGAEALVRTLAMVLVVGVFFFISTKIYSNVISSNIDEEQLGGLADALNSMDVGDDGFFDIYLEEGGVLLGFGPGDVFECVNCHNRVSGSVLVGEFGETEATYVQESLTYPKPESIECVGSCVCLCNDALIIEGENKFSCSGLKCEKLDNDVVGEISLNNLVRGVNVNTNLDLRWVNGFMYMREATTETPGNGIKRNVRAEQQVILEKVSLNGGVVVGACPEPDCVRSQAVGVANGGN